MEKEQLTYAYLKDFEFQKRHPFAQIYFGYPLEVTATSVRIILPVKKYIVERISDVVTGYYFELIVVAGDLMKETPLHRDSVKSQEYAFETNYEDCLMEIALPTDGAPWMVMVKMHTMEGKVEAIHPRHYAMRVIAVG